MATRHKPRSNDDLVVSGDAADGHGVVTGFGGDGPLTRDVFCDALTRSGIPVEWMPAAKDAKVQLTRAVRAVCGTHGLSPEQEKGKDRQVVEAREPSSRWILVRGGGVAGKVPQPGDAFGDIALVATLYDDEHGQSIEYNPPDSVYAIAIADEFKRLTDAVLYQAADVTNWLKRIHRDLLGAVRYGFGWYVPRVNRSIAEQIVTVFWGEMRWGQAWMDPPLPVASSAQLAQGLANGLCAEVDEQMSLLELQRRRIREAKEDQSADIGKNAAENFMIRLHRVRRRVEAYSALLGPDMVRGCTIAIDDAMIELDKVLEGGVNHPDGTFRDIEAEQVEAAKPKIPENSFAGIAS